MDRTPVKSSNVKSVGFDPATGVMEVEFASGGVYRYEGVPEQVHAALMSAQSVGWHLHKFVQQTFSATRIEEEQPK